jgi:exonuclease III
VECAQWCKRLCIDVVAVQEARIREAGSWEENGYSFTWMAADANGGAGVLMGHRIAALTDVAVATIPGNSRMMGLQLRFPGGKKPLLIVSFHAQHGGDNRREAAVTFWGNLHKWLLPYEKDHNIVWLCDANAQISRGDLLEHRHCISASTPDVRTSANGVSMLQLCDHLSMQVKSTRFAGSEHWSHERPGSQQRVLLDYMAATRNSGVDIARFTFDSGPAKSNHRAILGTLSLTFKRQCRLWVKDKTIRRQRPSGDEEYDHACKAARAEARKCRRIERRENAHPWMTQDIIAEAKKVGKERQRQSLAEYKQARKRVNATVRDARNRYYRDRLECVEALIDKGKLSDAMELISRTFRAKGGVRGALPSRQLAADIEQHFNEVLTSEASLPAEPHVFPERHTHKRAQPASQATKKAFTDGSCYEPGTPRARAGYGYVFQNEDGSLSRRYSGRVPGRQTSGRGELCAFLVLLQQTREIAVLDVYTDYMAIVTVARNRHKLAYRSVHNFANVHNGDIWREIWRELSTSTRVVNVMYTPAHKEDDTPEAERTPDGRANAAADGAAKHGANKADGDGAPPLSNVAVPQTSILDGPPSTIEIQQAFDQLKDVTSGPDGLSKRAVQHLLPFLRVFLPEVWTTHVLPANWKDAYLSLIPKQGADPSIIDNQRGLAVGSIAGKMLTRILLNRAAGVGFTDLQFGFTRARGVSKAVLLLKDMLTRRRARGLITHVVFVDFKKAYDSVDRRAIDGALKYAGFGPTARRIIAELYTGDTLWLRTGDGDRPIAPTRGVKQGCLLSPFIFNLILDVALMAISELEGPEREEGLPAFNHIAYADDVMLAATSVEELQQLLDSFLAAAKKVGLSPNVTKTKMMVVHPLPPHDSMEGFTRRQVAQQWATQTPIIIPRMISRTPRKVVIEIPDGEGGLGCPAHECPYQHHGNRMYERAALRRHLWARHVTPETDIRFAEWENNQPRLGEPPQPLGDLIKEREDELAAVVRATNEGHHYPSGIFIDGAEVARVAHFKYLGTIISQDLDEGRNLTERVKKAWRRFFGLMRPIRASTGNLTLAGKIFQGYVLPILLFGAETWTLRAEQTEQLRATYHGMIRTLCDAQPIQMEDGKFHRAATAPLLLKSGTNPIEAELQSRRMLMTGALKREHSGILSTILAPVTDNRRGRHAPSWQERSARDLEAYPQLLDLDGYNLHQWQDICHPATLVRTHEATVSEGDSSDGPEEWD